MEDDTPLWGRRTEMNNCEVPVALRVAEHLMYSSRADLGTTDNADQGDVEGSPGVPSLQVVESWLDPPIHTLRPLVKR